MRQIALELKAAQLASFNDVGAPQPTPIQQLSILPPLLAAPVVMPTFNPFSKININAPVESAKPDISQAFLEAVAASRRIAASRNLPDLICTNSNDSTSNGFNDETKSNPCSVSSSKLV